MLTVLMTCEVFIPSNDIATEGYECGRPAEYDERRRTLDHALRESDGKRNFATELQGIYLESLLEAITLAIARIKRDYYAA